MYSFKFPSSAVKTVYIIILQASSHSKKNVHSVCMENMKKEVRIPRCMREENFKNGLVESVCKNVGSITCLTYGQSVGCIKSCDKASGSIKFRRLPEQLRSD